MAQGATRTKNLLAAVLVAGVLLVATACGSGSATGSAELQGVRRGTPLDVSSVEVSDARDGSPIAVTPAEGELTLVYFGYTGCPDVCPTTFSDLRVAMEELGPLAERTTTVFITGDPERDTAEVLDSYVGSFLDRYAVVRIEDPARLDEVEEPFQASTSVGPKEADGTYEVTHTGWVYAVDSTGAVRVEWPFGTTPDAFAHDIELLLETDENR